MPQVPVPARKARAERLRAATARQKATFLEELVKTEQNILIERKDGYGHAENFADVMVSEASVTGEAMVGQTVRSRITGIENGKLVGETV
jgi:threonylcarbamoyladenosine tRNA methylthiotransferase MtaB